MGMIDRESKKKDSHFDKFDDKIEKLNTKKTYKIKNSNLKKMIEFLNKQN